MPAKPTYQRRTNTHGDILYTRDGQPCTEAEFRRNVPVARNVELRTYQRGHCESSFRITTKQSKQAQIDADDLASLEKIERMLKKKF